MLRAQAQDAGLDPGSIEVVEIENEAESEQVEFPGSPTIRIDGADFQPPTGDAPRGLTCRVYRLRDGRASPLPDPQDLRNALRKARA